MMRLARMLALLCCALGGPVAAETMTFTIDMPTDVLAITHGGAVGLAPYPAGIAPLPPELETAFVLTAIVRDETGTAIGVATELEEFPGGNHDQWRAWWTVTIPGRGTIIGYETEAIAASHEEIFAQVAAGNDWTGDVMARVANGPRADGTGLILAGTGEFEGATGSFAEWTRLTGLSRAGVMRGTMELRVVIDPKPVE